MWFIIVMIFHDIQGAFIIIISQHFFHKGAQGPIYNVLWCRPTIILIIHWCGNHVSLQYNLILELVTEMLHDCKGVAFIVAQFEFLVQIPIRTNKQTNLKVKLVPLHNCNNRWLSNSNFFVNFIVIFYLLKTWWGINWVLASVQLIINFLVSLPGLLNSCWNSTCSKSLLT